MAWYSKYVQLRVKQLKALSQRVLQLTMLLVRPSQSRRTWLVGSSLLLVLAPASLVLLQSQSNQVNSVIDSFTSPDEATKQSLDLNVESTVGQYGQSKDSDADSFFTHDGSAGSDSNDVSLQATITDQSADIMLNGESTSLDPKNDSYHKKVETSNGSTHVDISIKNNGDKQSGSSFNLSTSSNIKIQTNGTDNKDQDYSSGEYGRHNRDER
jgi:hypothetical protein